MAGNNLKLQVLLAAIDRASGPLKRIMGGSSGAAKALRSTQSELKRLEAAQRDIAGFRKLETQLGGTRGQLVQAQRELRRLTDAVNAAESPSEDMTAALRKQATVLGKLRELEVQQRLELGRSRKALETAGYNTSRLAVHERTLQADIGKANTAIEEQRRRLGRLAAAQANARKMHGMGMNVAAHGAGMAIGGGMLLQRAAGQMQPSLDFESRLRDIAITGGFNRQQEGALGAQVMADAKRWGQFTNVISDGLGVLVANGISSTSELRYYSGLLAKTSVATGGEMQDLGNLVVTLQKNLGIAKDGVGGALDSLAYAGKQGSFELRDMAKWMPQLTPQMSALGVSGRAAVDELGAALQVARLGAGTSDEAANNLRNYLSKIVSPDTIKNFDQAGIDLQKRLMEMRARGITPLQGSLQLVQEYMGKKGPAAAAKLQKALSLKDDEQRQAALEQLASAYALGDLFRDAQAMAFLRPALANGGQMASIQRGAGAASGGIDKDWAARMATGQKQVDQFNIRMDELKLKAGALLLPTINQLAQSVGGLLDRFSAFASAHPQFTAGLIKMTVAGVALITALGGLLVIGGTTAMMVANLNSAVVLLSGGRGLLSLLRIFPAIATGLRVIGAAVMANPIGLLLTLIAGAAYLIWKNWGTIGPMLAGVWSTVTSALGQAWEWIQTKFGEMWNFLSGLWTRFQGIGAQLMQGLIGGLLGGLKAVGDTINRIGGQVVAWFKGKLGIRSPSRVFAQLGDYTMQGLAGGLQRSQGGPLRQMDTLGQRMRQAGAGLAIAAAAAPAVAVDSRTASTQGNGAAASYAPSYQITIHAAPGMDAQAIGLEVRRQIEALDREKAAGKRRQLSDYD